MGTPAVVLKWIASLKQDIVNLINLINDLIQRDAKQNFYIIQEQIKEVEKLLDAFDTYRYSGDTADEVARFRTLCKHILDAMKTSIQQIEVSKSREELITKLGSEKMRQFLNNVNGISDK